MVLAAIPPRDPSPGSRLTLAADVPYSLVRTAAAGVSAQLPSSHRPRGWPYGKCSPLFVPAEAVGGEEGEGGSEGMDLEDEDEGEANEVEGGVVLGVALVDPFGGQ